MHELLRYLYADWKKTKHLSIRLLHLVIPICLAGVFIAYYSYSPWNPLSKVEAYFQILGIGFPILISLFTVLLAEQELAAGKCQRLLILEKKGSAFVSKVILLSVFGIFALILACGLFGTGYYYLLRQNVISYSLYWIMAFVLLGSNLFLYIWHLFLAFRFNKGICIGMGLIESLIAALLITGMGDRIWMYIPCAWGARFASTIIQAESTALGSSLAAEINIVIIYCISLTIVSLLAFRIWFIQWDGQRSNE